MTEIHWLGAAELRAAYGSGELSPVEVLHALQAHIARWEPHLNALYAPDPAAAMSLAKIGLLFHTPRRPFLNTATWAGFQT